MGKIVNNNEYNFVGHVFQSRYNGELIENDEYVLEASRWIKQIL
ncbi:hypothetical protein [Clostridium tagluense]|nr:hypothetical protein [Clostridium tagluense]